MKHEMLSRALDEISDRHIAEATAPRRKKRKIYWFGGIAAALAAVILFTTLGGPAAVQAHGLVAAPVYPKMASYPKYDGAGYDAWRDSQRAQYNQPEGYADSLLSFWKASIPALLDGSQEKNAVCSPVNIYMALAMLAQITGGSSRDQVLSVLCAENIDALRTQAGHVWNAHYCDDGATVSRLGASLWLDDSLVYDHDTVNMLAENYYASVYHGDLGSGKMNRALQDWLNEQTGGLLKEQAGGITLPPETLLALAATIFYQVKWQDEFSSTFNTEDIFHTPAGDVTVTYMNRQLSYGPYYRGESFGAVRLGLEDGGSMWLILPDEGNTPQTLLTEGSALDAVLQNRWQEETQIKVNLSLPKFDITADLALNSALKSLGITDVFDISRSDFTTIAPEQTLYLDKVSHAARVAIDEDGIVAAAYTVMAACGEAMPPEDEIDFILNRPFLFLITSRDALPLFAGIVHQP